MWQFRLAVLTSASCSWGAAAAEAELDRRLGAIAGAALADAAAMPLHWIYDTSVIKAKLADGKDAAFFSPPSCPFYTYPEGENTPYGQQNRVILAAVAANKGLDVEAVQDSMWAYYGPEGAPCHTRSIRGGPVGGCYWDGSTKGFVANYEAGLRYPHVGANDTQANALVHMVPLVAMLADADLLGMLEKVEELIRVTQNTDQAAAFGLAGARILRSVIRGATLLDAVRSCAEELQSSERVHAKAEDLFLAQGLERMLKQLDKPNADVVAEVGLSCEYPFNLLSGSHLVAQLSQLASTSGTEAYKSGVRQTIIAGGDSGSRSDWIGALLGAAAGEAALPVAWKEKYLHYDAVLKDAQTACQPGQAAPSRVLLYM